MPSRARPIATLLSAPPIDSVALPACRSRPGPGGATSTIVSPAVTTRPAPFVVVMGPPGSDQPPKRFWICWL